jgi:hypothetical protein
VTISHWWEVLVEEHRIGISSGGYFVGPLGGDSFTAMTWSAEPEECAEFYDYRDSLQIVPDLRSFSEEVATVDFTSGGYSLEIYDDDNPDLEENESSQEDDRNNEGYPEPFENTAAQGNENPETKLPPPITVAGFSSSQEQIRSGSPYMRVDTEMNPVVGEQRALRFNRASDPEGEVRAWVIRNHDSYKSFAAYRTPCGDVVLTYVSKGCAGPLQ